MWKKVKKGGGWDKWYNYYEFEHNGCRWFRRTGKNIKPPFWYPRDSWKTGIQWYAIYQDIKFLLKGGLWIKQN